MDDRCPRGDVSMVLQPAASCFSRILPDDGTFPVSSHLSLLLWNGTDAAITIPRESWPRLIEFEGPAEGDGSPCVVAASHAWAIDVAAANRVALVVPALSSVTFAYDLWGWEDGGRFCAPGRYVVGAELSGESECGQLGGACPEPGPATGGPADDPELPAKPGSVWPEPIRADRTSNAVRLLVGPSPSGDAADACPEPVVQRSSAGPTIRLTGPATLTAVELMTSQQALAGFDIELESTGAPLWADIRPGGNLSFEVFRRQDGLVLPCSLRQPAEASAPIGSSYESATLVRLPSHVVWPSALAGPRVTGPAEWCSVPGEFVVYSVLRTARADRVRVDDGPPRGSPGAPDPVGSVDISVEEWVVEHGAGDSATIWGSDLPAGETEYAVSNPWSVYVSVGAPPPGLEDALTPGATAGSCP